MKRLVQAILKPFGLRLARIQAADQQPFGLDVFFSVLKRNGFDPRHIVDIGANHGYWTRKALEYFPNARYTLVEPQDHLKQDVQDLIARGCVRWIHAGAGDQPSQLPFTISRRDDSSTFVSAPDAAKVGGSPPQLVEVMTLDQIVASSGLPVPDMVKIDAEGFDLKVLAGASTLLGKTEVFLVEAVVCCPDYQNTVLELLEFMSRAGYKLIDVTELNRSPKDNVLWLCELAFLRNASPILAGATSYE
jgi:FkbM family methyltransferase